MVISAVALTLSMTVSAHADSTTVPGSTDIKKMYVDNATGAVVVKIHGPGGKCAIRWVSATIRGRDGVTYRATGGCYPGAVWSKGLEKGTKLVQCSGYKLTYNAPGKFWRFFVPRTCMPQLTNKIKVAGELPQSAVPGEAGPTPWLARG